MERELVTLTNLCYNVSAETNETRGALLYQSAIVQHNILLWAKRPLSGGLASRHSSQQRWQPGKGRFVMLDNQLKQCIDCLEWKEKAEFRGRRCLKCKAKRDSARDMERYRTDPDYREAVNKQRREYYQSNAAYREHIKTRQKNRYWADPVARERSLGYRKKYNRERWLKCIPMAGGVCQKCQQPKFWVLMDFHHVHPELKGKQGCDAVLALDFDELDKCALLCSECHRLYTSGYWEGRWRKRDGLGWELEEWWYVLSPSGDYYDS